jgi:hypothetical protein
MLLFGSYPEENTPNLQYKDVSKKDNCTLVRSCGGGAYGCETSRLTYFQDNRLTDGDDVSLTRRPLDPPVIKIMYNVIGLEFPMYPVLVLLFSSA